MPSFSGVIRCCVLPLALLAAAVTTGAQARLNGPATIKLDEIPWAAAQAGGAGTSGASGIQTVVLKGDPTKAGLYVLALRTGPHVTIQAHSPQDDRGANGLSAGRLITGAAEHGAFCEDARRSRPRDCRIRSHVAHVCESRRRSDE